ncbi:MAG: DUF2752 domain-containing protein [Bacteroidales bacterium]
MVFTRTNNIICLTIIGVIIVMIYFAIDPASSRFLPKCLIHSLTAYQCPGCGSQRALHQLLHLNLSEAFRLNALFVVALPYVLFGLIINFIKINNRKVKNITDKLYGTKALIICALTATLFGIIRNIL